MSATEWGTLILVVFMICVWVIRVAQSRRKEQEKPEEKTAKLVVNMHEPPSSGADNHGRAASAPNGKAEPKTPPENEVESLDSIYARNVRKKICPYCETVNSAGADICCACGNPVEK